MISRNELEISGIELQISERELRISLNYLEISKIEVRCEMKLRKMKLGKL